MSDKRVIAKMVIHRDNRSAVTTVQSTRRIDRLDIEYNHIGHQI